MEDNKVFINAERLITSIADFSNCDRPFVFSLHEKVNQKISTYLGRIVEKVVGKDLYLKNPVFPLEAPPPRFEKMLRRLAEEKIIVRYSLPKPIPDWPRIPSFLLELSTGAKASGYDLDFESSATKAFAEAVERHAYTAKIQVKFIVGKWQELASKGAVNPAYFTSFSETQLQNAEYAWAPARSLLNKSPHLVPAQLVYLGYNYLPHEPVLRGQNSNGGAAGSSWDMAAHNAICELIERDALMIHWLNKISPPRVDVASYHNSRIDFLTSQYQKYEIEFAVLDITTDIGVPVMLTALREKVPGRPILYVSPRADLDVESAIVATLTDGLRAGYWADVSEEQRKKAYANKEFLNGIEERHRYWTNPEIFPETDFIFKRSDKRFLENKFRRASPKTKLEHIKSTLREHKLDCYLADITTPIAKEFGLVVLRAIIPQIYPLYLKEKEKYLGISRLFETPVKMNIFKAPKKETEMNMTPHPML